MKAYCIPFISFHVPYFTNNTVGEEYFFQLLEYSFIPFIKTLENLENDNVDYSLTLSLSPLFIRAIKSEENIKKYSNYLIFKLKNSTPKEIQDNLKDQLYWINNKKNNNLIKAIHDIADYGHIEIITSSATNAVLSLLAPVPEAVNFQINTGLAYFNAIFNNTSRGLYLHNTSICGKTCECVKNSEIQYVLLNNAPLIKDIVYPVMLSESNFYIFLNNQSFTKSFKLGIYSDNSQTDLYADQYLAILNNSIENDPQKVSLALVMEFDSCQKFDKQLNWKFLDLVLRKICYDTHQIKTIKPTKYIEEISCFHQLSTPGSLNNNIIGYYQNGYQKLFPDLHLAASILSRLKKQNIDERLFNLMAEQLLLAQCYENSDKENIITNNIKHLQNFTILSDIAQKKQENSSFPTQRPVLFNEINLLNCYSGN